MYVSAADNDYVGVTGTFLGTAAQGVSESQSCTSEPLRVDPRTGSAGALDGLTAQGNVGCDQLLCNDVNCTDVFTTGVDASGAISCAALGAVSGVVAGRAAAMVGRRPSGTPPARR